VLSVSEVAEWLGWHPDVVRQAARVGRLPARRIGKEWRFGRRNVTECLERPPGAGAAPPVVPAFADAAGLEGSLTSAQAAELLSVKPRVVSGEAAAGRLPGWKEGGQWRFDRGELLRHLRGDPHAEAERYRRPRRTGARKPVARVEGDR
jgi:excisionase family DNA binding protein